MGGGIGASERVMLKRSQEDFPDEPMGQQKVRKKKKTRWKKKKTK